MLTLRWRDYPRERRVMRHRNSVGLLYPNGQGAQPNGITPAKAKKQQHANAPDAATPVTASALNTGAYPVTWDDIAVDQLVLAKQDGPWGTWWEAIVVQRADDMLTLQWRDFPKIAPAVRHRLAVALLRATPEAPATSRGRVRAWSLKQPATPCDHDYTHPRSHSPGPAVARSAVAPICCDASPPPSNGDPDDNQSRTYSRAQ